jgi:hypothetical protein
VLLLLALVMGPAAAQANLGLSSKPFSSTDWEADEGNTSFVAAKAFDGNLSTRWNSDRGDLNGSFLGTRWDTPQTITKVVVREAIDRIRAFRLQQFSATTNDWADVLNVSGDLFTSLRGTAPLPLFTMRLPTPLQTTGIRLVFDEVIEVPTIHEVEVYSTPAGTLQGTVRDEQGAAIAGAIVQVGSERAFTGSDGKYTVIADAGVYNVTAEKPGAFRKKVARNVTLGPAAATLDFALTALPPNLALAGKAASSSDRDDSADYNAAKANDGNVTTRWTARDDDEDGAWLEIGWDTPQTFTKVNILQEFDRIRNYTLQRWDEGQSDWVDLVTNVAVPSKGGDVPLSNAFAQPITATKVRLLVVEADAVASVYEMIVSNPATATVKGVVKDAVTGQPVPNAQVSSDLGDTVVADAQGAFTLVVEPDTYVFTAQAQGYFPGAPVSTLVTQGQTVEISLILPPPGPNLAKTGKPISSSQNPDQPATNVNDDNLDTAWQVDLEKHDNEWVGVTWETPTKFTVVQLRGIQTLVQISTLQVLAEDGKTWVDVPNTTYSAERGPDKDFFIPEGITTTGLRWYIKAVYAVGDNPALAELIVYNSPIPK